MAMPATNRSVLQEKRSSKVSAITQNASLGRGYGPDRMARMEFTSTCLHSTKVDHMSVHDAGDDVLM